MKKNHKISIIIVVLFLIFVAWKYWSSNKKTTELIEKLKIEYPLLLINEDINCTIINIYHPPPNYRTSSYFMRITFSENKKYSINTKNCITSNDIHFNDIVKKGVKLIKNAGSDTLIVVNNQSKYLFIIKDKY